MRGFGCSTWAFHLVTKRMLLRYVKTSVPGFVTTCVATLKVQPCAGRWDACFRKNLESHSGELAVANVSRFLQVKIALRVDAVEYARLLASLRPTLGT